MRRFRYLALALVASWVGSACTGPAIPMATRPGGTLVIFLDSERGASSQTTGEVTGFESDLHTDPQRGSLAFKLRSTTSSTVVDLGVRYMTRWYPDPASDSARADTVTGQIVAVLDVPTTDENGAPIDLSGGSELFWLDVSHVLPDGTPAGPYRSSTSEYEITLLSGGLGTLTPRTATEADGTTIDQATFDQELSDRYPHARVDLTLDFLIAAADFEVSFAGAEIRPLGVVVNFAPGHDSIVRCQGCDLPCAASPESRTVRILMVGPEASVGTQLGIPFEHCPGATPSGQPFSIVGGNPTGYRADGTAAPTNVTIESEIF